MQLAPIYNELSEPLRSELLAKLPNPWYHTARQEQIVPEHVGAHAILAQRGWGKTRSGAEWVLEHARTPNRRIILIGNSARDLRNIMIEGESGIVASATRLSTSVDLPMYEPARRKLTWPNGSVAYCHSADENDRLRGLEANYAWWDEAFAHGTEIARATWVALDQSTRLAGSQILATGSPTRNWVTDLFETKLNDLNPYYSMVGRPTT